MEYSIFGCRLNKYYLNQWLNYFTSHPFADKGFLITTCEVTDRAKQKWIKLAKKKLIDGHHLYLTGCGTLKKGNKIQTEKFYALYPDLRSFSDCITLLPEEPENGKWKMENGGGRKGIYTKEFVVIQNGCDNHCSFCLTVQKRGKHSSRNKEEIVEDIKDIERHGGKEIVLTGVNIAAWGCSNSTQADESNVAELLQYMLDNTAIPRIRLSSLGPEYLNDDFFRVIQNERILPHFHLSIQSFSDGVLQRMRRNYTSKILTNVLTKFRALKKSVPVSLGADIIIGFPGETEEEFQETIKGIQKFKINKVHSFPFSDHHIGEKIPASALSDQIDQSTKKRREKELKKIADTLADDFIVQNTGITHEVLVEGKGSGWTENYIKVEVDPKYKKGEIIEVIL
ncbi:MAG: radical SAM protein [candidate division SR1 bacterium]|nr:radical SAM protein [candidate division SR1 bacterium]